MSMSPISINSPAPYLSRPQITSRQSANKSRSPESQTPMPVAPNPNNWKDYTAFTLKQMWATKSGKAVISLYALGFGGAAAMITKDAIKLSYENGLRKFPWKKFFLEKSGSMIILGALQLIPFAAMLTYGVKGGKELTEQLKERNLTNPTLDDILKLPYFQQHHLMRKMVNGITKENSMLSKLGLGDNPLYLPPPFVSSKTGQA